MNIEENYPASALFLFALSYERTTKLYIAPLWGEQSYGTYKLHITRGGNALHQTGKLYCILPAQVGYWRKQPIKLPFTSPREVYPDHKSVREHI